jgi:steroid 5-alpha reductase family enzyme
MMMVVVVRIDWVLSVQVSRYRIQYVVVVVVVVVVLVIVVGRIDWLVLRTPQNIQHIDEYSCCVVGAMATTTTTTDGNGFGTNDVWLWFVSWLWLVYMFYSRLNDNVIMTKSRNNDMVVVVE